MGYRHIDTAAAYYNEQVIGKVLNDWISSGRVKREELFITTKVVFIQPLLPEWITKNLTTGNQQFQLPFNANRASNVEKYIKQSLEYLQLDYLDLYLIHAPFGMKEGDEILPKDENGEILMDMDTDHVSLWKVE